MWTDQRLQALSQQESVGEVLFIVKEAQCIWPILPYPARSETVAAALVVLCQAQAVHISISTAHGSAAYGCLVEHHWIAGPSVKVEEVKSPELARLLQQREAAYVAALMAILQWEAVQAAYLNADRKGKF